MLEQSPKSPQLPDGLHIRSGDNGPPSEHEPPHILGNGQSGIEGLFPQSFIFFRCHPHRASGGKAACFLLHCLSAFMKREKRSAERLGSPEAQPLASLWLAGSQLPTCKFEPLT